VLISVFVDSPPEFSAFHACYRIASSAFRKLWFCLKRTGLNYRRLYGEGTKTLFGLVDWDRKVFELKCAASLFCQIALVAAALV